MPTPPSARTRRPFAAALAALAAALLVAGCGGDGPKLLPVQGKVTADDQPLSKGSVRFVPDTAKGNAAKYEPAGEIGADGSYTLSTLGKPGAPAGWYKVSVVSTDPVDSSKPLAVKSYVGKKYNDTQTSGLSVEVVASPPAGAYDLKASAK
jgi:predicted small lipoprotein YifL